MTIKLLTHHNLQKYTLNANKDELKLSLVWNTIDEWPMDTITSALAIWYHGHFKLKGTYVNFDARSTATSQPRKSKLGWYKMVSEKIQCI